MQGLLLPLLLCNDYGSGWHQQHSWSSYLLHSCQALELGAAEVLLLKRRRLQHEVLLLCRVHLLQVLGCRAGLPVQGLLDHLRVRRGQEPVLSMGQLACCRPTASAKTPSLLNCSEKDTRSVTTTATNHHSQGGGEVTVCKVVCISALFILHLFSTHAPLFFPSTSAPVSAVPVVKVKAAPVLL